MIMKYLTVAVAAVALSGCGSINAWVAGTESLATADAAAVANNIHTANVATVGIWARASCGLTLGGLAGAGSATVTEAAMKLCTPAGVTIGGVSAPITGLPAGDPFAIPAAPAK